MTLRGAIEHALEATTQKTKFLYEILGFLKPEEDHEENTVGYVIAYIDTYNSTKTNRLSDINLNDVELYSLYSDIADSVAELGYETKVTWDIENEKLFAGGFQIESLKDFKSVMGA